MTTTCRADDVPGLLRSGHIIRRPPRRENVHAYAPDAHVRDADGARGGVRAPGLRLRDEEDGMSRDCRQCMHAGDPELPVMTSGRDNVVGCLWRPTASARVPFWCRPGLIRVGRERARECDCYEEKANDQP